MINNAIIAKTIAYVKNHAENQTLSLQSIADAAGFSLDYYNRMFFSHTGFTVMAYVNYVRLKKALLLLRTTGKTILEIALEIGYQSQEGFTKAFSKNYGMTPSEYRRQKRHQLLKPADLADETAVARFLYENPDFAQVDADAVIDHLLGQDAIKYGRVCGEIRQLGMAIAAQSGDFEKGFIGIRMLPGKEYTLELVTEDPELLAQWIQRFKYGISICCNWEEKDLLKYLHEQNISVNLRCSPHAVYQGRDIKYELPEDMNIRKLDASDLPQVKKWAQGKNGAYIRQLMKPEYYQYEEVLEFGVFENGELIAIAGCGVDEVRGLAMNDCCIIRFAAGKEDKNQYRPIYAAVTKLLWEGGIVPYDAVQFGAYAKSHGDFTAEEMGYRIVNRTYDVVL